MYISDNKRCTWIWWWWWWWWIWCCQNLSTILFHPYSESAVAFW